MIATTVKLRLNQTQEQKLDGWLWNLTGLYNWAIRKIELDAKNGVYHSSFDLQSLLNGHGRKMEIPVHVLQSTASVAWQAWEKCFHGAGGKPKLKGRRNRLNWISFRDPLARPVGNSLKLQGIGAVRFHKQEIPEGKIKAARAIKRASGWYLNLVIDAEPRAIKPRANGVVGIDPGFKDLLTLSSGEKIRHPRELEACALRLAQAQRGKNRKLSARLQERQANQRKDRNHKVSHRLVAENERIFISKDKNANFRRLFGKSVASSSHSQLRSMLTYKCRAGGRQYVEVPSRNSTRTCSACGALTGPTGFAGLKVRQWECACGATHDRDVNAAVNALIAGLGLSHERYREVAPENLRQCAQVGPQMLEEKLS